MKRSYVTQVLAILIAIGGCQDLPEDWFEESPSSGSEIDPCWQQCQDVEGDCRGSCLERSAGDQCYELCTEQNTRCNSECE
jgi:hypothetical protein